MFPTNVIITDSFYLLRHVVFLQPDKVSGLTVSSKLRKDVIFMRFMNSCCTQTYNVTLSAEAINLTSPYLLEAA